MKKIIAPGILSVLIFTSYAQTIIADVSFPNSISKENSTLVLNGGGVREKLWIDVYAAGLYLTAKSANAAEIVNTDQAMAVRLHIVSGMINSENMSEAVREGFGKSTNGNIAPIKDRMEQFISAFQDHIKVGDVFLIFYKPGEGVKIYKNDLLKTTATGLDFKKALFGIWLGENPVSSGLKKGLLGG